MKTSGLILVSGFIVSHNEDYTYSIVISSIFTICIKIQFNLKQLPSTILYSGIFGLSNIYYSVSIVFIFGIYFLWVLNNLIRRSY